MSDNERQNIINLFKNNVKGYLAINDIQEIITCITYLFWNSKFRPSFSRLNACRRK